jgi:glycosyltransferase involved in cell wall biosynthesis
VRIAVLTSRFPYPLERGDKLRMFHQIRHLHEEHEIYLFCICESVPAESDLAELYKYCKRIEYLHVDSPTLLVNIVKNYSKEIPLQSLGLYDSRFHDRIKAQIIRFNIDAVFCQLYRMALYCNHLKVPVVFDYMDAFGVGLERRVKISPWYIKWLYLIESKKIKLFESRISNQFEAYTIISNQDKSLIAHDGKNKVNILPNGIDTDYFQDKAGKPRYDIVFVGNLGYLPNIEAVEILVNKVIKAYQKKYKTKITCLIAGARPSLRLLKIQSEEVKLSGWRQDIRTAYSDGKVLCAPLFSGTGQQNKILEAMSMERPCITTSFVNDAIGAEHGNEILIADSIEDMVSALYLLLNDQEIYNRLQSGGRKFVTNNYNWKDINEKLNFIFAALLKQST